MNIVRSKRPLVETLFFFCICFEWNAMYLITKDNISDLNEKLTPLKKMAVCSRAGVD